MMSSCGQVFVCQDQQPDNETEVKMKSKTKRIIKRIINNSTTCKKAQRSSILKEPSYEEEQRALSGCYSAPGDCGQLIKQCDMFAAAAAAAAAKNDVIKSPSAVAAQLAAEREQRARNRCRQTELASLLIILFGLLTLLTCCPAHCKAALFNTTNTTSTGTTISTGTGVDAGSSLKISAAGSTTLPLVLTKLIPETTTTVATAAAAEELITTRRPNDDTTLNNEDDDELTEDISNSPATLPNDNRLGALLVRTAGEAADEMVVKLRSEPPESTTDEAENGQDIGEEERKLAVTSEQLKTNNTQQMASEELRLAMQTYGRWRSTADEVIDLFSRKLMPIIIEHGYEIDAQTMTGLLQVFNGIRALKPWALKLLDASAKLSPGILVGTQSDFGDFDECLNVRVDNPSGLASPETPETPEDTSSTSSTATSDAPEVEQTGKNFLNGLPSSTVVGRYCLADIEFPKPPRERLAERNEQLQTDFAPIELRRPLLNFSQTADYKDTIFVETGNFFHMLYVDPLRIGVCLTNKIDPDSFAQVLNKILADFRVSINFHGRCVTKYDKPTWTRYQTISVYLLISVCSLVVLCTMLDILHTKLNKLPLPERLSIWKQSLQMSMLNYRPLFTSFSILRNTKRLFKPQQVNNQHHQRAQVSDNLLLPSTVDQQQARANILLSASGATCQPLDSQTPLDTNSGSESSPSIERRASVTGSALNLISEHSSLSSCGLNGTAAFQMSSNQKRNQLKHQFQCSSANGKGAKNGLSSEQQQQQQQQQTSNLMCLHGIRVITMTWMIVNHTYLFGGFFVLWAHRRLIDIAEWPKSLSFQLVLNGWLTVETYFFLSAAIIVLNVMPLIKARKFAYLSYILHRLVRLLPAYLGLVCLNFLWPLVSSGPVWLVKGKSFIQTPCENYLWTNFLFINNWIWPEKQCMVHTWFLSADFQLYLLAPIIVYLLCRRPLFGHSLNLLVALIASIFSGFVIYANKLMPTTLINKLEFDSIKQQLSYSYFATYQHMGPYCLGIFIGYLLHKRPQVHLPRHVTWALWLLMPPLSFTTLLLTYLWNGAYDEPTLINPSPLISAFYVAIHRTIWTSLLAWIVFACATGRAKLMNNFLSHPIFVPLSRLSFSIYLVHLPIIMFRALNLRHTIEWTDSNILWEACGNFIASILVGYFVNVTFESPFINLEAVMFRRNPSAAASSSTRTTASKRAETRKTNTADHLVETNGKFSQLQTSNSSQDNCNDSDDSKSSETFSEQPESSPEQDRKLSEPASLATTTESDQQLVGCESHAMHWSEYRAVKALRPKQQNTVEQIFGTQVEPLPERLDDCQTSNASGTVTAEPSSVLLQRHLQQMAPLSRPTTTTTIRPIDRLRRYSAHEIPMDNENGSQNDIIYPLSSVHQQQQNYARVAYNLGVSHHLARPSQYATLARTSRFNHELPLNYERHMFGINHHHHQHHHPQSSALQKNRTAAHQQHHLLPSEQPLVSRPLYLPEQQQSNGIAEVNLARRRSNHLQRNRQHGRYNTLTGADSLRDWRRREEADELLEEEDCQARSRAEKVLHWRQQQQQLSRFLNNQNSSQKSSQSTSTWQTLQPGALIPRIDSSTLRRNNNVSARNEANSSILEESNLEEREEAAL